MSTQTGDRWQANKQAGAKAPAMECICKSVPECYFLTTMGTISQSKFFIWKV